MDEILTLGCLLLSGLGVLVVLPIVAIIKASSARKEVDRLRFEVRRIQRVLEGERTAAAPPPEFAPRPEPAPPPPVERIPAEPAAVPPPEPEPAAPAPAPLPEALPVAKASLEEKIALVWFTRIGAVITLIGAAYFFKYAVDNDWIGPTGRVAIGALAGIIALVFAERTRVRTQPIFTQAVLGLGLALLLFSAYASYAFYRLVPVPAAYAAFFVISLLGGALSVRHRAQTVLLFAMVGAFLAPVLLSTGKDRPLALFGYLLVVTSLSHAVSVKMNFRWTLWLGIAGTATLFAGWYLRHFDAHPAPQPLPADVPLSQLEGPYLHLLSRSVPLGVVTAFFLQWLAVWRMARRPGGERLQPIGILVSATVLAHAGFAALLFDKQVMLGGLLAGLGIVSSILLHLEKRSELLMAPLFASFAVLVATMTGARDGSPVPMMSLLGLWGLVYAAGFLRGKVGADRKPGAVTLSLVGGVGLGFAILTAVLLGRDYPHVFAGVLAMLSLLFGALAMVAGQPLVWIFAVAVSFLFFLVGMPVVGKYDPAFIAIAAGWAAVYLGAVSWDLFKRNAAPTAVRLGVLSLAGLGFAFLAEAHTEAHQKLLRAALLAGVGAVDFSLGAALLRRGADRRRPATVMLGQALALFAGSVALLFSGATITVIWAVLAAVVVILATVDRDRLWMAGGLLLFVGVMFRLLYWDLWVPGEEHDLFIATSGASGSLKPTFLLNPRAYALVATGVALLVAARSAARTGDAEFRRLAAGLLTFGHAALLTLVVLEVHNLVLQIPALPARLDDAEFRGFLEEYAGAVAGQQQKLMVVTSLLMALYAASLVGVGFGARNRAHRYLGLGLFALTLLKLAGYDVFHLRRVYQIAVFVGVGVLLLCASSLYARFGKRLVALVRDGSIGTATLLFFLFLPGSAFALQDPKFAERRLVEEVAAPGFWRVEIDPAMYRRSRSDLADVRLYGPDGREVPYLIREVPVRVPPVMHPVTLVDPVTLPDGGTRVTLDLGRTGLKHSQAHLQIAGQDFFRRTRIEISGDEQGWNLLSEGSIVYRVASADKPGDHTKIVYPTSDARYLRVTLLPGADNRPLSITGAEVHWVQPSSLPVVRALPAKLEGISRDAKARKTQLTYDLGEAGLPISALRLSSTTPAFERRAEVGAANHRNYWGIVGSGVLYRLGKEENLVLGLSSPRKQYLRVEIHDGDDSPLAITGAEVEYRAQELIFRAETAGAHWLHLGAENVGPPRYDLPAVLARAVNPAIGEARLGPLSPNPALGGTVPEPTRPFSERYGLALGLCFAAVVIGLGVWTVRLLRQAKRPE